MHKLRFPAALFLSLCLCGCAFVSLDMGGLFTEQPIEKRILEDRGPDEILVLELTGPINISNAREKFDASQGTLERLEDILTLAEKNASIKGVILKIDSPGGTVTASDLIYRRIRQYKARHKLPVVACITQLGTSGAYMAALAADKIVALPTSCVGNVGVIMPGLSVAGLMDKLGIKNQTITTGKYKDIGNPLRDMTDDERKLMADSFLKDAYLDFLDKIKKSRPEMTEEDLKIVGDGRIFNARYAKQLHVIDEVGYYETAREQVCQMANLTNPSVVVYRRADEAKGGFYSNP